MRTPVLLLAFSLAGPAGAAWAADLWCMPDTICRAGACRATEDEETSVRLRGHGTAAPSLRSHAEDIALRQTRSGEVEQWEGRNAQGQDEILAWRPQGRAFTYLIRSAGEEIWKATGRCEVQ